MERNIIEELGSLALATRLKNLSERLAKDVGKIYKEQAIDFEPRWFAVVYALKGGEEMPVTKMAMMLQQTHPAVNQVANVLVEKGLIEEAKDEHDQRKRLLKLSKRGQKLVAKLESLWDEIRGANDELLDSSKTDLLGSIKSLEAALDQKSMYDRVKERIS